MHTISANEAKTQFGATVLKAQQEPVQINKNGKPVAVMMSMAEFEQMAAVKQKLLNEYAAVSNTASDERSLGDDAFDDVVLQMKHKKNKQAQTKWLENYLAEGLISGVSTQTPQDIADRVKKKHQSSL